jgi:hypothetical protein
MTGWALQHTLDCPPHTPGLQVGFFIADGQACQVDAVRVVAAVIVLPHHLLLSRDPEVRT